MKNFILFCCSTSVSTSSQEIVKIQLRCYMGSVLKRPESVIVLRDVVFEGLKQGHRFETGTFNTTVGDLALITIKDSYLSQHQTHIDLQDLAQNDEMFKMQMQIRGLMDKDGHLLDHDISNGRIGFPSRIYRGTTYKDLSGEVRTENCGHLGTLDHYKRTPQLFGASFVYSSHPDPKSHP